MSALVTVSQNTHLLLEYHKGKIMIINFMYTIILLVKGIFVIVSMLLRLKYMIVIVRWYALETVHQNVDLMIMILNQFIEQTLKQQLMVDGQNGETGSQLESFV